MEVASVSPARRSLWPLWVTFAIFFIPIVIAVVLYFGVRPQARSNYGSLLDPQRDVPVDLRLTDLAGRSFDLSSLRGKWVLVQVASGACPANCQKNMFYQRQIRKSLGKDQFRVERVVLLTDAVMPDSLLLQQFAGAHFVRADSAQIEAWLPAENGGTLADHVFVMDPLTHVMLRFPRVIDHTRMRKDLSRLLWTSKIG
ncbi:MAG: SCO family protein [Burkholderiaceae bacterium]|jgi:hypothetical protein